MHQRLKTLAIAAVCTLFPAVTMIAAADVQLGPRPFYLVEKMDPSGLKDTLQKCADRPFFFQTPFSIGHRGGGTLQFPEHTKESHEAGARMGAGILECDVTFTSDGELVCRHDQCDLHTTTNILITPLAAKCSQSFTPAEFDASGTRTKDASALCCTSDLTLDQFKSLKGKMDASNPNALTAQEFQGGTPNWRTDLYATGGTLLSHKDSIQLIKSLGAKFTPELKGPNRNDILYWLQNEPSFGMQAVYLDDRYETITPPLDPNDPDTWKPTMQELAAQGIKIIAPPMWVLLTVENGQIVPSLYAKEAKKAGLDIITWTLERSGRIVEEVLPTKGTASPEFYYQSTLDALHNDGDLMVTLDVLAQQVGILGIFSDWSATVTYYANCMGLP